MLSYLLHQEFIAQYPAEPRDAARLLVVNRTTSIKSHSIFRDLPRFLRPEDCLVLNDTKVIPARLYGKKEDTGGAVELLLLESRGDSTYRCLGQPGKRLKCGARLVFNHDSLKAEVVSVDGAERIIRFSGENLQKVMDQLGEIPLPPYIRRPVQEKDTQWYQTVFARQAGAVAAPTAGLHFTENLLEQIRAIGVHVVFITLHVGWGTFKPVGEEELKTGRLHEEKFSIPSETVEAIHSTKSNGGRIIAVGTTVVRTLETWAREDAIPVRAEALSSKGGSASGGEARTKPVHPSTGSGRTVSHSLQGTTDLFIRPPFQFNVVNAMITNFHLPGTSLLHLVSAFAGEERIRDAYEEAVRERYRFYSYGDAMLIL